jgi:hypothetical protein
MSQNISNMLFHESIPRRAAVLALALGLALLSILTLPGQAHASEEALITMDARGVIYTLQPKTGRLECAWQDTTRTVLATGLPAEASAIAVDLQRTVYVGTATGSIWAVSAHGVTRRITTEAGPISDMITDRDGNLILARPTGAIHTISRARLLPITRKH